MNNTSLAPRRSSYLLCSWYITYSLQTPFMASHHSSGNAMLPVRFFKIILKTNLERLKIPNMFTRKFGGYLSNPVFVKPPDGTEWKVYWIKQNGEVWFVKGWKEFTENYSLDHGYLVLFKYEGTSQFDVLIFDQSTLEICYPSCAPCDKNVNLDQGDDKSVEILGEWPHQKAKQKSPLFSPPTHKKMRELQSEDAPQGMPSEKATKRTSSLNWPKEGRAQEVAAEFISYNPFFTVSIKPFHLSHGPMYVPDLKGVIKHKDVFVKLLYGKRLWNVKLLRGNTYRSFSAGWPLCAKELELQEGDVCVFELTNREGPVFEVHVFKCCT